jgi:pyridoxal phosphate enzyme (YggS family)
VSERHLKILERIDQVCARCGRKPSTIKVIAVSKKQSVDVVRSAFAAGLRVFGENYLQEAQAKQRELVDLPLEWHFIGGLQSNKIKSVVGAFEWIHSVDRVDLVIAIAQRAQVSGLRQKILIEVNVAEETSKHGVALKALPEIMEAVDGLQSISVEGLMAMPPLGEDALKTAEHFRRVRQAGEKLGLREFSMGTSSDFELAIQEGATMIRLGAALLGDRPH